MESDEIADFSALGSFFSTTLRATLVDMLQFQDPSFSVIFVVLAPSMKFCACCLHGKVSLSTREESEMLVYSASP